MYKYFKLQLKRTIRHLPGALLAIILLLGGVLAALQYTLGQDATKAENQKVPVAICGDIDDVFFQMGLAMVQNLGNTRYMLELRTMTVEEAYNALAAGQIAAYAVIPDGFMDHAMAGELLPIKMITTYGATGLVSIFKEELTEVIGELLANSEKGVFSLEEAMYDQGFGRQIGNRLDALSIKYLDHIAIRNQVYRLEVLGIADQLGLREYLICGLGVLFLLLACLPFGPLQIGKDPALYRLLRAKGCRAFGQTAAEFSAFFLAVALMAAVMLPIFGLGDRRHIILNILPVVLMVSAYSFLLFQLASDLMTGIVMQFLLTLGMCFVCGCIYPTSFFPAGVQQTAAWLPAGLARSQLASCFTGEAALPVTLGLLGYAFLFFGCSVWLRLRKIREVRL
jgi:ABC-2 type transport system permease protein